MGERGEGVGKNWRREVGRERSEDGACAHPDPPVTDLRYQICLYEIGRARCRSVVPKPLHAGSSPTPRYSPAIYLRPPTFFSL